MEKKFAAARTATVSKAKSLEMQAAIGSNDTAWAVLYGALVSELGVNPQNFQLLYPMTSWNWPTNNQGFTTSAQYDFCSTIPQWSATGAYVSAGTNYDTAYQQFLNAIMLDTTDPTLAQEILAAQNNLTQSSADFQSILSQAKATYKADSSVVNNVPTFTNWLTTLEGLSYGTQLTAAQGQMSENQDVLTALTKEQKTPNIANALAAMIDTDYYVQLSDAAKLPSVPEWDLAISMQKWVNQVQGGGGTGGSITIRNDSSAYSYNNTWAQGSASVDEFFWQVYANGSWSQVSEFYTDSSLDCTITFKAWDTIGITPAKWYSGTNAFKAGPFTQGYTATQPTSGSGVWMFSEGGLVPCLKTAMLVCYQPSISMSVSNATYQSFQQNWSAAGGISIGPFQFDASAGSSSLNWSQTSSGWTLTVNSTSTTPLIFGVNVALQPQ